MIQKKICMLGAFAVGKTSLVKRFVTTMFSEKYQTTVGVKIDKKILHIDEKVVTLLLWDLYGEDEFQKLHLSYLRGASGYLLVIDSTRQATLTHAYELQRRVAEAIGNVPFIIVLNKTDLFEEFDLDEETLQSLHNRGWPVIRTSAKTGEGVEEVFLALTQAMLTEI